MPLQTLSQINERAYNVGLGPFFNP